MIDLTATLRKEHRNAGLRLEQAEVVIEKDNAFEAHWVSTGVQLIDRNNAILKGWPVNFASIDEILQEADRHIDHWGRV